MSRSNKPYVLWHRFNPRHPIVRGTGADCAWIRSRYRTRRSRDQALEKMLHKGDGVMQYKTEDEDGR